MNWTRSRLLIAICIFGFPPFRLSIAAEPAPIDFRIRRAPVVSTALAATGYNKRKHILEIEFCNGAIYRYLDVPPAIHRELMASESKARYYDAHIRGNFHSLRLRAARPSVPPPG